MRPFITRCHYLLAVVGTFLLLHASIANGQTIRYVSTTGTTDPASATTSWATSTTDLQGAIAASNPGDQVWVRSGTYKPGGDNNRSPLVSFWLKNGVRVLGGFPASGTPTLTQRDPRQHQTTLSGDVDNDNTLAGNSLHIFYLWAGLGLDGSCQVDGFEITGGNANNTDFTIPNGTRGGGVYMESNSPAFLNCVFRSNRASADPANGSRGSGGGVMIGEWGGTPRFVNCLFANNTTDGLGGGLSAESTQPSLINCSFVGNSANQGGGYYASNAPNYPQFTNCSFRDNTANTGFAGYDMPIDLDLGGPGAVFTNCVFWNNGGSRAFPSQFSGPPTLRFSLLEAPNMGSAVYEPTNRVATVSPFASTTGTALSACTPDAIGTADLTTYYAVGGPPTDLISNPRFRTDGLLDLGAEQLQSLDAPLIVRQPASASVVQATSTVTTSVSAVGPGNFAYQWFQNGTVLTSQTQPTLTLTNVLPGQSGQYVASVSSGACSLTSTAFDLTVNPILTQSVSVSASPSLTITQGQAVTLTASGYDRYLWAGGAGVASGPGNRTWTDVPAPVLTTTYSVTGISETSPNGGTATVTIATLPVCNSVIYVTPTGAGNGDGSSWANAVAGRYLQGAINVASACGGGQVWVAQGLYRPSLTDPTVSYELRPNVQVYGGFVGTETSLTARPPIWPAAGIPSSSTLAGNLGGGTFSKTVLIARQGIGNNTVLDGFVIADGRSDFAGGGIYVDGSSSFSLPVFRNCSVVNNRAMFGAGAWLASSNRGNASAVFLNCAFVGNQASVHGGAIFNQGDPVGTVNPLIVNCLFERNMAGAQGGAIYNNGFFFNTASPFITNCAFVSNSATTGGGAMFSFVRQASTSRVNLLNCSLRGNRSTAGGWAIQTLVNDQTNNDVFVILTNCVLWDNGGASALAGALLRGNLTIAANTGLFEPGVTNYTGTGVQTATASPFAGPTGVALLPCSPAINAGNLSLYANNPTAQPLDLLGNPRYRTINGAQTIDLGASQFAGEVVGSLAFVTQPPVSFSVNEGDLVSIPVSVTATRPITYQWLRDGVSLGAAQQSSTLSIGSADPSDSGTYVLVATETGLCSLTSTALQLTVAPVTNPIVQISASPSLTITRGNTVTLTATGGVSFTWAAANGAIIGSGQSLTVLADLTTAYSVTGTNAQGFSGSATVGVTVLPLLCRPIAYVTQTGAGLRDGSSWANAYPGQLLRLAIDAAAPCGGQVWVARGEYKPTQSTDRTISFNLRNGVRVFGGFVGTETTLAERPPVNPVLSQPSGSTLTGEIGDPTSTTDNSFHVVYNQAPLDNSAVLDGFVITGGMADGDNLNGRGGGMLSYGFPGNIRTQVQVPCTPTVQNCLFTNNVAGSGGAVSNYGLAVPNLTAGDASPVFVSCLFTRNTAVSGAGMHNEAFESGASARPLVLNCAFRENRASQLGGAMTNFGFQVGQVRPFVVNSVFVNNTAPTGGAIYNMSNLNTAQVGGITVPTFQNCSFQGNVATADGSGGAIASRLLSTATWAMGTVELSLNSCAFWNNATNGASALSSDVQNIHSVNYCLLEPGITNIRGANNPTATTNPFTSTTDMQPNPCGPAIDAGDPAIGPAQIGTGDIAGNPRFFQNGRIDIGAYELQALPDTPLSITAGPAASSVVCAGTSVSVPVSVSGTGTLAYQWYKDGQSLGVAQSTSALSLTNVQPTDSGSYSVVVSNACNSVTSTAFNLTVNTLPIAALTVSPSTTLTCAVPTLTLSASGASSPTGYTLTGPGGLQIQSSMAQVNMPGTYMVIVTGANGCTAIATTTITSNTTTPAAPTLAPGASLTTLTSTTATLPLTPLVTALPSHTLTVRGSSGVLNPPVVNISTAGVLTFTLTQTNTAGCVSPGLVVSVTVVSPLPPASQSVCRSSQAVLSVLPGGVRYQWFRLNGSVGLRLTNVPGVQLGTTTASLTLVSVQTSGTYTCQVTDANGAVQTVGPFVVNVTICGARVAAPEPAHPLQVRIAPNPVVGNRLRAVVTGAEGEPLTLELTDLQGRSVATQRIEQAAIEQAVDWDVSHATPGTLLLRVGTSRHSQTVKVLKD